MLVVTTNDIPGWAIERVCGEAMGLTVRPTNATGLQRMLGAEMQNMIRNLAHSRNQALGQLIENARVLGGNAIVAMRFDTSELGGAMTEICAYGTAVQAVPVTEAARHTAKELGYGTTAD